MMMMMSLAPGLTCASCCLLSDSCSDHLVLSQCYHPGCTGDVFA